MESLKSYFFVVALLSLALSLSAQPTYILFDQSCMERLSFEQSRPDTRQDYVVYHISLRSGEKLVLEVGEESEKEQNYVPESYLSCNTGGIDKTLVTRINNKRSQVFIVYPKNSRKYVISPVAMAAVYSKQGNVISYQSPKYQFQFDLDYGTIGENIALNNAGVKLYFEGKLTNDCAGSFLFRQLAPTSTYPLIDLVLMPEIGIVEERAGANASAAMNNALVLQTINGLAKDRYLREICGMEPGTRGALTARQVPTTPTSFNTAFNPPIASNLPPGAIVPGGGVRPPVSTATPPSTPPVTTGIPNQVNLGIPPAATPAPNTVNPGTTPPATMTPVATPTTHTVVSGETLYRISKKYDVSVADIKTWNNLSSNTIRRGQVLTVASPATVAQQATTNSPTQTARSGPSTTLSGTPVPYQETGGRIGQTNAADIHVVQPGETVASIALTYGYTARRFREINNLGPTDYAKVGQQLKVSDCDCPPEESSAAPTTNNFVPNQAPATTPTSFSNTGGRISPNTFTARTPENTYAPPVVSPGDAFTPVQNAGGLTPRNTNTPPANVYNTILPTGYDAPPTSYDAPNARLQSPATATMSNLERRGSNLISGSNNSGFGETPVVPADPRPQSYSFTPSSPYPVPTSGSNNTFQMRTPTATTNSTPSSYYTPPTAVPNSYNTTTPRISNTYFPNNSNQRRVHIVHEGESLYGIAKQYGLSVAQLSRLNQLEPNAVITPYQTLYLE